MASTNCCCQTITCCPPQMLGDYVAQAAADADFEVGDCCPQTPTCCPEPMLDSYVASRASDADCETWYILTEFTEIINAENSDRLTQERGNGNPA